MTSHEDPIQELIDAAEELVSSLNHGVLVSSQWYALDEALKPFRPDPEEELRRKVMAELWGTPAIGEVSREKADRLIALIRKESE